MDGVKIATKKQEKHKIHPKENRRNKNGGVLR